MTRQFFGAIALLALPAVAGADEDYRHGRIRYVEDGVSIQRAAEPGAEEAEANVPFLPGDRIWTDDRGRVEFRFESGAFLRLDNATKLDYLDNPGDRIVLRLWSGSLYVHEVGGGSDFEIETPGGVVETRGRGVFRIDARPGETRVAVYDGEATLQGDRSVRIREGQEVDARDGQIVRGPSDFDRGDADPFAMWADERHERARQARQRPADLPQEASSYYDELYDHGSWVREPTIGYVWRPRVAIGWQPYSHGRWMWTAYGWTWLAYEPWGWAPFHYGRWGYSPAGWYWIPQRGWGPAWVSWAVGGPYVGWCPLGFGNRPLIVHERRYRGGHAIPRAGAGSWVYARHGDLTARDLARRRVQIEPGELAVLRPLASPRARLTRDLRVVEAPVAVRTGGTRAVRTKPTPADTIPELQGGNQTLPPPVVRRRRDAEGRHDRGNSFGAAAGAERRSPPSAPSGAAATGAPAADEVDRSATGRRRYGNGGAGRARYRAPEATATPETVVPQATAPEAPVSAAPPARARRSREAEAAPRARGGDDAGAPREYAPREYAPRQYAPREYAPPRERSHDGGARSRGEGRRSGSEGEAPRARERAPRQEPAPATHAAPADRPAPAAREGARSRRPKD